jgi:hypothetical protein
MLFNYTFVYKLIPFKHLKIEQNSQINKRIGEE